MIVKLLELLYKMFSVSADDISTNANASFQKIIEFSKRFTSSHLKSTNFNIITSSNEKK